MTDPDLLDTITAVIDGMCYSGGINGPRVAALGVLGQEVVADGLAALPKLQRLDARHQPVRWSPDSPTVVCSSGCGAYPCETRRIVDGEVPE